MNVHFIAIGGSAMHNLAIALHKKGYDVSGSDDEIFEPSKSRLAKYGLLPDEIGWNAEKINNEIDAVILGMHAHIDNPELAKAKELGLKIYSYPEYLYEQSKNKIRIAIGGSHGKTTITSMILHVMQKLNIDCDYMVGAQLEGFEVMVKLSETAKYVVLEGDEYLTSPIDRRPKFHLYKPNIALLSGIAWDHINVFPTFDNYLEQFKIFTNTIENNGTLVYFVGDENVKRISEASSQSILKKPYGNAEYEVVDGATFVFSSKREKHALSVFGKHNLQNIEGARLVCESIGITENDFYEAIRDFKGASKRLQLVKKTDDFVMFKDFAHSPSKLKATVGAVKEQFKDKQVIACMELHTYSSLNKKFLGEYNGCMDSADKAFVYYNPHTVQMKRLENVEPGEIKNAFNNENVEVFNNSSLLKENLLKMDWKGKVLLMMSSGNFDGIDFEKFAAELSISS